MDRASSSELENTRPDAAPSCSTSTECRHAPAGPARTTDRRGHKARPYPRERTEQEQKKATHPRRKSWYETSSSDQPPSSRYEVVRTPAKCRVMRYEVKDSSKLQFVTGLPVLLISSSINSNTASILFPPRHRRLHDDSGVELRLRRHSIPFPNDLISSTRITERPALPLHSILVHFQL